jgi:hypothetical protein
MGSSVVFTGSIIAGPQGAGDCSFPSGITNIAFGTSPNTLPAPVSAYNQVSLNSPSAFQTLPGLGPTSTVTQGNFLYVRSNAPVLLQLVYFTASGNVTVVIPLYGPFVWQVPQSPSYYLVSAAIEGTAQVEFYVSGNQ